MFNVVKKSIEWGHDTLTLETGKIARQADAAVLATYGETSVLATVVYEKKPKPGLDFFPLTVHYQEKYYAAGKIPGGFFKREARPTEKETLTSRLIDRPIRPLFVEGFRNETQVICTVLSYDMENDPDIVAMIAASAALTLSGAPFYGPIGAARVGFVDGEYVLNPAVDDMEKLRENPEQRLDLVVAGTKDAVMMVESEAYELTEAEMLGAVKFGHEQMQPVIDMIIDMAEEAAKEPFAFEAADYSGLYAKVKAAGESAMRDAFHITDKLERQKAVSAAKAAILAGLSEDDQADPNFATCVKKLEVRSRALGHPRPRPPHRRPRPRHRAPDRLRGRHPAAHPRLGAVHPRRDPGPRGHHARHRRRRADDRRAARHVALELPAALQLPRLLGRRDPPADGPGPARDRPRQARLARAAGGAAGGDRLPLHHPHRLGDHRVQRLVVDGDGLRRLALDDGRRRAAQGAGRGRRDGPDPRGREVRGADRHPRRRGSPRRHGLQGRGHRRTASPRCRWTSRSPASPPTSWRRRWRRPRTAGCTSSARWARPSRRAAPSSRPTPRASRPCRSPSTRSAKSSARAARSSARSSRRPAPRSTSTTTA